MVIRLEGLEVFAFHGVFEREKREGQRFFIDAALDLGERAPSDSLSETVDYGAVAERIAGFAAGERFDLIESLAEGIADMLVREFDLARRVEITVHKPNAPISVPFRDVSVTASRENTVAYLGLGSNLGDREAYLRGALAGLRETDGIRVLAVSSILETPPYGVTDQGPFLNACAKIETTLSPECLLAVCKTLEARAHRVPTRRWGERTLDLDILLYGDRIVDTETLQIPHVEMHKRAFVLDPLSEIAKGAVHPVFRKTVAQLREELHGNNIAFV